MSNINFGKKILFRFIILIFIFLFAFNTDFLSASQESNDLDQATIINREIKAINSDISSKKTNIEKLQEKQKKFSEAIKAKQREKATLKNQMALIDNKVAKSELDIELVKTDADRVKLEIKKTNLDIEELNKKIEKEKEHIAGVLRLIYKKENTSPLEIMLLNDTLSDFLSQVKYLEDMNDSIEKGLKNVKKNKRKLEGDLTLLDLKKKDLEKLKLEILEKKKKLESDKESKLNILTQVGQSEREYQRLLAQAKKEQESAAADIANMERLVRAKLAALDGNKLEFNNNGIIWPVPKNTITTYFHDPDYPFRYIFEHPAIDIRASQGTTIRAAASGYVARVKFDGSSHYAYIMLIHGDGLSTVYGHISKSYVKADDYVVQGQKIGLTGGTPGTPGAGRLTTGPHLHFEVRLNGIPVDPLGYLP